MKNDISEFYQQLDADHNLDCTKDLPDSWNLELVFPNPVLSLEQVQDILRQEGIIL
jgi:hypothetical protein